MKTVAGRRDVASTASTSPKAPGRGLGATLLACAALLPASSAGATALAETLKLAPHRAVYDMSLDRSRSSSSLSGIHGRMVFDFAGSSCDGYTLNMRMVTRVMNRRGQSTVTDLRSSTWEEGSGKQFRFNSSQFLDQKLSETTRGQAEQVGPGKGIEITIKAPTAGEFKLPDAVLFPTQHSLAILTAARDGRSILQAKVYDGSEKGRKVYDTTAFIGKTLDPGAAEGLEAVESTGALDRLASWPISISYFDEGGAGEGMPSYELTFRLYANGVSRKLLIDYGDFAVRGSLRSLEFHENHGCPDSTPKHPG